MCIFKFSCSYFLYRINDEEAKSGRKIILRRTYGAEDSGNYNIHASNLFLHLFFSFYSPQWFSIQLRRKKRQDTKTLPKSIYMWCWWRGVMGYRCRLSACLHFNLLLLIGNSVSSLWRSRKKRVQKQYQGENKVLQVLINRLFMWLLFLCVYFLVFVARNDSFAFNLRRKGEERVPKYYSGIFELFKV